MPKRTIWLTPEYFDGAHVHDLRCHRLGMKRVRPTIVMVSVVGLAPKDHGRARTLKGLRAGDAGGLAAHRPAMLTLQGPCPAMVL